MHPTHEVSDHIDEFYEYENGARAFMAQRQITVQEITWDQIVHSQEHLVPDPLTWVMELPIPPMAVPGRTKFV